MREGDGIRFEPGVPYMVVTLWYQGKILLLPWYLWVGMN